MKEIYKDIVCYHAKTRNEWRKWLIKNHDKTTACWLIIYHKNCGVKSIYYDEAVEEALCFGWIDSKPNKRDHQSMYLYFTPRKSKSVWSKLNKTRVDRLIAEGLMTPYGQKFIDLAKQTGTWDALNDIDNIIIPEDFSKALKNNKVASRNFEAFSNSSKRIILDWIRTARKAETRAHRISETIALAAKNIKANLYTKKSTQ